MDVSSGCGRTKKLACISPWYGGFLCDFNICDPEGRFNAWNQTITDGDPGKTAVFHSFFPYILEVAQPDYTRRNASALGDMRTLSRIDRFFVILLVAEARDFHCSPHVVENLGKKIIASDHAAVRFAIQKPTNRGHQSQRIPSWMSKHPIFCSIVQQLHDDHRFSHDPFCALAECEDILHHAKKITKRELLKQTHYLHREKLLLFSTASRAYRNRHPGTLMRCCEAWKPIEDCFDILSFGCIDFQRLSQIFASLARENLETRETEVSTLPWTQTEKDVALARCRNGQRA